jgi:hypothetical protein
MTTETATQGAEVLASARLTIEQTEMLLVKSLITENKELSDAVDGKQVNVICQWQTGKGSDPEALVHVYFIEDEQQEVQTETEDVEATGNSKKAES